MNKLFKKKLTTNIVYIIISILFVLAQIIRISNIDFISISSVSMYSIYSYLVILILIPILLFTFMYIPSLIIVKYNLVITINRPLINYYKNNNNVYKNTFFYKTKQSSLQVFRC